MTPAGCLLALISVLVGLAIADLALSLHRLFRTVEKVRWDWLPLVTALYVGLHITGFWWAMFGLHQLDIWQVPGAFMVLAAFQVSLFLLATAALPDRVPADGIVLREYYASNFR